MPYVMVDSNVLLDVLSEDQAWYQWSATTLATLAESYVLLINPFIYSEVSVRFSRIEDLEAALPRDKFRRDPLPWPAAFLAAKCWIAYRERGGPRRSPMPDFYIGAHASVCGAKLLTRDPARYRAYFPRLEIIAPT
jgi:predicted nucleic acid-binding protein